MRGGQHTIGELCIGGDWACAHGDAEALGDIAEQLAARLPEPIHCELVDLATTCRSDLGRATGIWTQLKARLLGVRAVT
jgi:hypothetical protein